MLPININKTYFALILFLLIFINAFEVHYVLYLITILFFYSKISKELLNIISFFVVIIFIAVISSFFNEHLLYSWIKDISYFSRPILAILAGYLISKKINDFGAVIKFIVFVSLFFAVTHILKILFLVDFSTASVSDIRYVGGISNEIEVLAIVILLTSKKLMGIEIVPNKLYKKIVLLIFAISFFLYLSRTMIATFTILYLASFGYLKITKKSIKYGVLVITIFGLFYAYLYSREFERGKPGIESFLYKMKIAPAEIFIASENINTKNHAYLWDHWRAYEAMMALNQMDTNLSFFIGKGFGSLVDLKFKAPLGDTYMRYIPMLHNGYVNLIFKSGVLGLLLYLLLLLTLYLYCYKKEENSHKKMAINLIAGLSLHYLFTTLIVTGMYNKMEPYVFVLGILLYFSSGKEKKILN
ncbi:hypothetical protein MC378_05535 [Polaribacter sp. MSW13]|uniref:Uncharacterized protein n=1 Tax=Polaribacter marinus TaxID=2916838 RepID=A0A9X1VM05_9FLAO|nr:hypothetical protein [Polaribacter marinus]MCI2228621.1 hypothetical protein [Polaribacter marinus]